MIKTVIEKKRGCGFRKPGGLYLRASRAFSTCGMLPIPLTVCPCCNQGIKPARGFVWVTPDIWKGKTCSLGGLCKDEPKCYPFSDKSIEKVGLLFTGTKFYKTSGDFIKESLDMGISKRISQVPKDLKLGETWVMLAHRKPESHIFAAFIPEVIEYVVKGDESPEFLANLEKRGIQPVKIIPEGIDPQHA